MKIEIERDETHSSYYGVRCGDRYNTCLGRDEALYTVACIITGAEMPGWMRTEDQHREHDAQFAMNDKEGK